MSPLFQSASSLLSPFPVSPLFYLCSIPLSSSKPTYVSSFSKPTLLPVFHSSSHPVSPILYPCFVLLSLRKPTSVTSYSKPTCYLCSIPLSSSKPNSLPLFHPSFIHYTSPLESLPLKPTFYTCVPFPLSSSYPFIRLSVSHFYFHP